MIRRRRRSNLRRRPRNPSTITSSISIAHEIVQANYGHNNNELSSQSPGRSTPSLLSPSIHKVDENAGGNCGREKLMIMKRQYRGDLAPAGRVRIPEMWGHEGLLKEWIDCSAFNASLAPPGLMSARAALVDEARRDQMASVDHYHDDDQYLLRLRVQNIGG
ncbi:hypothetical protein Scep_015230 [Stephania cephalantha]|uniref:Protein BIC1 n=1 Tax=Stephania cephalantha TaxID=152367 RepID=A0AAP0P197_9MAGN